MHLHVARSPPMRAVTSEAMLSLGSPFKALPTVSAAFSRTAVHFCARCRRACCTPSTENHHQNPQERLSCLLGRVNIAPFVLELQAQMVTETVAINERDRWVM